MMNPREVMTIRNLSLGVGTACLLLGVSAVGGACDGREADSTAPEPRAVPVAVETLQRRDGYAVERYFTGRIVARRTSDLGFERGGKVVEILVDEGQRIAAGAAIARLDTALLEARRAVAQARLDAALAQRDELIAGARPFVMEQARALVREREAELGELVLRHGRVAELLERRVAAQSEFDEIERQKDAARARETVARQALAELEAGARQERLAAQAAVVAQEEARVAELNLELQKSTLFAPYDAVVSLRRLDEGTVVDAGTTVVRLVEDAAPEARIGVPESVAGRFVVGEEIVVQVGSRRETAEVVALLPELDPITRTRPVFVRLSQPAVPGEIVRLLARETVEAEGFWIPISALTRAPRGLWSCYALEDDGRITRVSRRLLEVIFTDGERAYVSGTLHDGDRIVRSGTDRVVAGQRVEVAQED